MSPKGTLALRRGRLSTLEPGIQLLVEESHSPRCRSAALATESIWPGPS